MTTHILLLCVGHISVTFHSASSEGEASPGTVAGKRFSSGIYLYMFSRVYSKQGPLAVKTAQNMLPLTVSHQTTGLTCK